MDQLTFQPPTAGGALIDHIMSLRAKHLLKWDVRRVQAARTCKAKRDISTSSQRPQRRRSSVSQIEHGLKAARYHAELSSAIQSAIHHSGRSHSRLRSITVEATQG